MNQLLERYMDVVVLDDSTREGYLGYIRKHVEPLLGGQRIGSLDADIFDSFYAELRRCRDHCSSDAGQVDHRTSRLHACDERCTPHTCKPLAPSTVRQIHYILSGALRYAVRWRWVSSNPISEAEPPAPPKANPRPPRAAEAARIVNEAWKDPQWGTVVWLTMVTGYRRGELCAIRWRHLDLETGVLHLERSIGQIGGRKWEKSIKTHQDRRIVLDPDTVTLLTDHRERCLAQPRALGVELAEDAFVFSLAPDGSTHLLPDSVTQRYGKMVKRLGIKTSIDKLRHYSATELINAGVNIRTMAGRLGNGSGGVTTLRTYTAWGFGGRPAGGWQLGWPDAGTSGAGTRT